MRPLEARHSIDHG